MQIEQNGLITSESGGHQLTFAEKRHRYSLDGKWIGSVTGALRSGFPEGEALGGWKIGQGAEYAIHEYSKADH